MSKFWENCRDGALGAPIVGGVGMIGISFFNPGLVSAAGSLATFVGIGALACPFIALFKDAFIRVIDKDPYLNQNPDLKDIVRNSGELLINMVLFSAAASLFATPVCANVACIMLIPVLLHSYNILESAFNLLEKALCDSVQTTPSI